MLEHILDLHTHSKYARACSPALEVPAIAAACEEKGITVVSTGDFTHPSWFKHLEETLVPENQGLYVHKGSKTKFILGTEISCIYKDKEKTRRVHLLVYAPSLDVAKQFNDALEARGVNLRSDGRPIMGVPAKEILKIALGIDPTIMVIPAHVWTPWFAIFGSKSGYDSVEECFEELSPEIFALETGLSSDPAMNHRLSQLDRFTLISNSDAHSLENLGREANVLAFDSERSVTYDEIRKILKTGDKKRFLYTIEFYPEEGMYHVDGHRDCDVSLTPAETKKLKEICPKCKKKVTVGVLHRVDDLADRAEDKIDSTKFIPHKYIVPLREIIAQCLGVGKQSKKVVAQYHSLAKALGSEFAILLHADEKSIADAGGNTMIAQAIIAMRAGNLRIEPGYDGRYGKVQIEPDMKKFKLQQSRLI